MLCYWLFSYEEYGIKSFDEHWGTYAELCNNCYAEFDYIDKYGSLTDDSRNISNLLNVENFAKCFENSNNKYKKSTDDYFRMVPWENILKLYEVY